MTGSELILDHDARRALARVYALLLRLGEEETADGDGLDSEPQSAVDDAPAHQPGACVVSIHE
jgi:hypothetical protein